MGKFFKTFKWTLLTIVVLLIAIFYYKNHFLHLYAYYKLNIGHVHDIPSTEFAEVAIPEDWKQQEIGKLTFRLPDGFQESDNTKKMKASGTPGEKPTALFKDKMVVIFNTTFNASELFDLISLDPSSFFEEENLTWPKFLLKSSQFNSSSFSWLKSPKSITRDTYFLVERALTRSLFDKRCLYQFKSRVDWIAQFNENERSIGIFWQETDSQLCGSIVVETRSGTIDPAWIESFCQSLDVKKD